MFAAPEAAMAQEEATTEMAADTTAETMSAEADSAVVDSAVVDSAVVDSAAVEEEPAAAAEAPAETREVLSFHQTVKKYFIEGGATFMAFVLICLILGLALSIERIIYLNMATTNTGKLLEGIEGALGKGWMQPKKFAATPAALWLPSSSKASTAAPAATKKSQRPLKITEVWRCPNSSAV